MRSRPAQSSMSPSLSWYSPGVMARSSNNRVVDGDQFGAVREGGFHLDFVHHVSHAVHHVFAGEDFGAGAHQFGHGAAFAGAFHDFGADQGHRFGVVQFQAFGFAAFGQQGGGEQQQLVFVSGGEFHG